jgi:hypothetical protein
MAKNVSRVNGRGGESMWCDGEELSFRTGGRVQRMPVGEIRTIDISNAEDARALVQETELVPYGAWTEEMPTAKGKSDFVVATSDDSCWVMEINKNQSPNALSFVRGIKPVEKPKAEDFKLYAAIQTPLGAVFAVGSIVCVCLAIYFIFSAQMAIPGIIAAIAAIVMFVRVK